MLPGDVSMTPSARWWSRWRQAGPADILVVDLRPNPAWDEPARAWLDPGERARADRFVLKRSYRQYTRCRSALRANLCELLGSANRDLHFGYGEHGKPHAVVKGRRDDIAFNVSHSGMHGLIAFAPAGRLGVDLEDRRPRENLDGIGARVYGARELAILRQAEGNAKVEIFYRLWTMKEALIKALGAGFSLNPARFEVPLPMVHGASRCEFRFPHPAEVRWRLENLEESRFAAAVAFELGS